MKVCTFTDKLWHRKFNDVLQPHRRVARKSTMFRSHLPRAIAEPPRWIGEDG
jgi:hypothetical protein